MPTGAEQATVNGYGQASSIWRWLLPLSCLTLVACWPIPRNSSEESRFLQNQMIPDMIRWSKSSSPTFALHEYPGMLSFQYICAISDYESHSSVNKELSMVNEYRGIAGEAVPEMNIAIVGIKHDTAHVAYLEAYPFSIYGNKKKCHRVSRAVLTRVFQEGTKLPRAALEEIN